MDVQIIHVYDQNIGIGGEYLPPSQELPRGDYQVVRFSMQYFYPQFTLDPSNKVILMDPDTLPDTSRYRPLTVRQTAEILYHQHKRRSPNGATFGKWHTSIYQGKLEKEVKILVSNTYNHGCYAQSWDIIDYPPLELVGLNYQGSINFLYYSKKDNKFSCDSCLKIFLYKEKEIVVIKLAKRKILSLAHLAAEKISDCLSDKEDLTKLTKSTGIPAACSKIIENCL